MALEHLTGRDDGHLDEVHALRNRHAADLVLLHMGGEVQQLVNFWHRGGVAWAVHEVTPEEIERLGFSVAHSGDGTFVAHELGHSMGLQHERLEGSRNLPFPYSHGFNYERVNPTSDAHITYELGTVMSTRVSGWNALSVLAFSNPALVHPQDPSIRLGVPGDAPSSAPDGPADAVRHLNELRGVLANVRPSADADSCSYRVAGDEGALPADGGAHQLRVETQPGCAWTASGGPGVASVSPAAGTGSGEVEYRVGANDAFRRPVELLVAGRVHARPQDGRRAITPVCERSRGIRYFLESRHPDRERTHPFFDLYTPCEELDFGAEYLAGIRTLHTEGVGRHRGIDGSEVRPGDFDGFTAVAALKLHSIGSLPSDLFFGMTGLRVLEIGVELSWEPEKAALKEIEPGAFRGLPGLRRLEIYPHRLARLEAGTFDGLPNLDILEVGFSQGTAVTLEPGAFRGLSNAVSLRLGATALNPLARGVFNGMGKLKALRLGGTGLESLAPGAFDGLPELLDLSLSGNRLVSLPAGLFSELANLRELHLSRNDLTALEPDAFAGLSKLYGLWLGENRLRDLPPGLFGNLESLKVLSLSENPLGGLGRDTFTGLDQLRGLYLDDVGLAEIEPGTFDPAPRLELLYLASNRLREIAPGTFAGLELPRLHLARNPGAPFTFSATPVALSPLDPVEGQPMEFVLQATPEAPFGLRALLSVEHGSLRDRWRSVGSGEPRSSPNFAEPHGREPVTVRVDQLDWPYYSRSGPPAFDFFRFLDGHSGIRVAPGPPLTLYGFPDVEASRGGASRTFDLPSAFSHFLGDADYAASSDDDGVAGVAIDGRTLRVAPQGAGTAEVTVTATAPDGETMTRRFSVEVVDDRPSVPLFLSGSHAGREGFARVVNRSGAAGEVFITAVDGEGARREPLALRLPPYGALHFNSRDLEEGNPGKGLADGVGFGVGDWRLEFDSGLDIDALAYVRTRDGFVTGMRETAPSSGGIHRIATFNPASNPQQLSRLRVVNPGDAPAAVTVRGVDDAGASPGGPVRFRVPAGGAREFDAAQLEAGDPDLEGALGDGEGKWRLAVESDAPVAAMSLLESASTGHLTNLSSGPVQPDGGGTHHVPLFPAASDLLGHQGFVRVINRSDRPGTVRILAFDAAGVEHGPLELSIGAGMAAHFNSDDLEFGAAGKGLSGSTGPGGGDWRLALDSGLDIGVLAYVRTGDGFLTGAHGTVAVRDGRRRAATFNPGSNTRQVSVLRLVNPTGSDAGVSVVGTDDRGNAPVNGGDAWFLLPAGGTLELDAAELEAGLPAPDAQPGQAVLRFSDWDREPLGDGSGKWQLSVDTEPGVLVQSLLRSPTGHLTNLSADGR
ncbi:MAG: hypothetical protein OXE83_04220 [Gammaproteobacteria bacterium]|nr:hypothetical protein [Gammaproteobacteria bacterium]